MAAKALPCPTVLRLLLAYTPETGALTWRPRPAVFFRDTERRTARHSQRSFNATFAGKPAMTAISGPERDKLGGAVFGVSVQAHRVAWAIHTGAWPKAEIDHINGIGTDNRLCNLREANRVENCRNRKSRAGSSSRFLGVDRLKNGRFRAQIMLRKGVVEYLGLWDNETDAAMAYDAAAKRNHGEFARLNFP